MLCIKYYIQGISRGNFVLFCALAIVFRGGTNPYVVFATKVTTKNTNAGDLTGLVVTWNLYSATSGTSLYNGTLTGWSGVSSTKLIRDGISLTLSIGSTDVLTATNPVLWLREYTNTLVDGVDFVPQMARCIGTSVVVGLTSTSPNQFISGTDYDLAQRVDYYTGIYRPREDWGGAGNAQGICWKTSGNPIGVGSTYWIVDAIYYGPYAKIYTSVYNNSNIGWCCGFCPSSFYDVNTGYAQYACYSSSTNGISFSVNSADCTAVSNRIFSIYNPSSSIFINYWISIKPDCIILITKGDPANNGVVYLSTLQKYNSLVPDIDFMPWLYCCSYNYSPRDVWEKSLFTHVYPYWGNASSVTRTNAQPLYWSTTGNLITDSATSIGSIGINPNKLDNKWYLYTKYLLNAGWQLNPSTKLWMEGSSNALSAFRSVIRNFYNIANNNFSSFDELVDIGNTYLLVVDNNSNSYAILEQ